MGIDHFNFPKINGVWPSAVNITSSIICINSKYLGVNIHSLQQFIPIFIHFTNTSEELKGKDYLVSGMLLYARTNESIQPDNEYMMSGNRISVKTLDLNRDFSEIKNQLDNIVINYLE